MTKTKNIRRRNYRNLTVFGLGIFVAVFLFVFLAQRFGKIEDNTSAANLANFNAGYIISDYQMTDYTSMTEPEIYNFLWAKGRCYNTNFSGVGTRVDYFSDHTPPTTWHVKDGHTVCLAEENINGESAAHIIWQAAQDYHINPKVLIVLIQKETGLITDSIPNSWDYQRTAGYGCPDTAACSEKYYGFKNQIRNAASLFRIVMDGNSSYYPIGYNNVRYNPDPACGSSTVYIQNLATSALYRYTPYQPNAGALAAGYSTAPCGAYGNRNFFAYFEDWFGDILGEGLKLPESSFVIEDGEYVIESTLRKDVVLDVDGGRQTDGANTQIYANNNSAAQKWLIVGDGEGAYMIKNSASDKVLDVAAGNVRNGANVQMYSANGSCAQKWRITKNSDGSYSIYSVCSARVLDVYGGNPSNRSNVQIYAPNGSAAQKWNLIPVRTVEDGEYVISLASAEKNVIDIDGGVASAKLGTNIQVYTKNGTDAQKWQVTYDADGYYTILNIASGMVLDVLGASMSSGTNVQLYASNNSCAQKWKIVKDGEKYKIISACSGLLLDASNNNVRVLKNNKTDSQKWKFSIVLPIEEGNYVIQSALKEGKVMDVTGGLDINGTNIQLYDNNGSTAQKWKVTMNDDKSYSIKNLSSDKSLDVVAAGTYDGVNVQLYGYNGSCAQRWKIEKNTDKTYTLYSMCSGKALDVAGGSIRNNTNIQLYTSNSSTAQRWKLVSY